MDAKRRCSEGRRGAGARAGLFALAVSLAGSAHGSVMGAQGLELVSSVFDMAGAPAQQAGAQSLSHSLGQPATVGPVEADGVLLNAGFYGALPPATFLSGAACAGRPLRRFGMDLLGVPVNGQVCLNFAQPMVASAVSSALRVRVLRDKDANMVDLPVSADAVDTGGELTSFRITVPGDWASNALYAVVVGTDAVGVGAVPLAAPVSFHFQTQSDPSVFNTYVGLDDPETRLAVEPHGLSSPGHMEIYSQAGPTAALVEAATSKLRMGDQAFSRVYMLREFNFFDADGALAPLDMSAGAAALRLPPSDRDGDGVIDGSRPPARVRSSAMYFLDERDARWARLPQPPAQGGRTVLAARTHLGVVALIGGEGSAVDSAYAFPVPFRPYGPEAGSGAGRTGSEASGITFANLPSSAVIEVFNVRGERVWRGEDNSGLGRLSWDGRGGKGPLPTGVYIYVVKNSSGEKKLGKLAIIR